LSFSFLYGQYAAYSLWWLTTEELDQLTDKEIEARLAAAVWVDDKRAAVLRYLEEKKLGRKKEGTNGTNFSAMFPTPLTAVAIPATPQAHPTRLSENWIVAGGMQSPSCIIARHRRHISSLTGFEFRSTYSLLCSGQRGQFRQQCHFLLSTCLR
jgi:hypothetical protein